MSTNFPAPRDAAHDPEHPLARAFASFTEAAGSLERTYGQLQGQVTHLRQELEVTNRDLATSLDENHRIRERLRRILEGLPCGVLVIEAGSCILTLNPEAARLAGGNFETADALPAELREALDRARQTGEEPELQLASGASHPGSPVWVAIRHAWLEQSQARATSVFILRDISEAKKLERDREQLRRRQALVEMSALLAHEIRNPLGSLELFAGLLAESNLEGESRRWIEHVQAGLRTLSATVNNVLHLHNAPQPEFAPTDGGQLLEWAYDFLLPLAKQARVELQVVNGLHGVAVSADRHRLEQVLLNLALNALRFMPGGGWLSIRGRECAATEEPQNGEGSQNNEIVEISVRDTGPGIAPEDLPRIFDAGFSTRPGSSGLGLAVCRRILEQHG
ncbi:MAG: ATP-binding protein, partial [Terriglobales bacterium]